MTKKAFLEILHKFNSGVATQEEEAILNSFCEQLQKDPESVLWTLTQEEEKKVRMFTAIMNAITMPQQKPKIKRVVWYRVAAVIVVLVGLGGLLLRMALGTPTVTVATGYGEHKTVILADGSKVYMGNSSTLTYPDKFTDSLRQVTLTGEGFFEVVKNSRQPFVVNTGVVKTRVLGTTFNVKNYTEDEDIAVTLATGKVWVTATANTTNGVILTPGMQAVYGKNNHQLVSNKTNVANAVAWRNNMLVLNNESLEEVAYMLNREFGLLFVFTDESLKKLPLNGEIKLDELNAVLENLEFLTGLKFEIDTKKKLVTIKKP